LPTRRNAASRAPRHPDGEQRRRAPLVRRKAASSRAPTRAGFASLPPRRPGTPKRSVRHRGATPSLASRSAVKLGRDRSLLGQDKQAIAGRPQELARRSRCPRRRRRTGPPQRERLRRGAVEGPRSAFTTSVHKSKVERALRGVGPLSGRGREAGHERLGMRRSR